MFLLKVACFSKHVTDGLKRVHSLSVASDMNQTHLAATVPQAVQQADANARARSSEHINALEAQILKLQAGG